MGGGLLLAEQGVSLQGEGEEILGGLQGSGSEEESESGGEGGIGDEGVGSYAKRCREDS